MKKDSIHAPKNARQKCVGLRGVSACMNAHTPSPKLFPIHVKDTGLGIESQIRPRISTFVDSLTAVSLTFTSKVHSDAVILFAVFTLFRLTRSWKIIISVVFILTFFLVGKSCQIMIPKAGFGFFFFFPFSVSDAPPHSLPAVTVSDEKREDSGCRASSIPPAAHKTLCLWLLTDHTVSWSKSL